MTVVEFSTSVKDYQTREPDPSDSWDIGDVDGYVDNVTARPSDELQPYYACSLGKEFPDSVGPGSTLYVVVADYTSGCTFGRTGAQGQVLDAFEDPQEAQALAEAARATTEYNFTYEGVTYRADWMGYFESLSSLDIWEVTVNKSYPSGSGVSTSFKKGH